MANRALIDMTVMKWTKCSKRHIALKHISCHQSENSLCLIQYCNKNCFGEDKQSSMLDTNVLTLSYRVARRSFRNLKWKCIGRYTFTVARLQRGKLVVTYNDIWRMFMWTFFPLALWAVPKLIRSSVYKFKFLLWEIIGKPRSFLTFQRSLKMPFFTHHKSVVVGCWVAFSEECWKRGCSLLWSSLVGRKCY